MAFTWNSPINNARRETAYHIEVPRWGYIKCGIFDEPGQIKRVCWLHLRTRGVCLAGPLQGRPVSVVQATADRTEMLPHAARASTAPTARLVPAIPVCKPHRGRRPPAERQPIRANTSVRPRRQSSPHLILSQVFVPASLYDAAVANFAESTIYGSLTTVPTSDVIKTCCSAGMCKVSTDQSSLRTALSGR